MKIIFIFAVLYQLVLTPLYAAVQVVEVVTLFDPPLNGIVISKRSHLSARLEFQLHGSGMVRARWMIATPNTAQVFELMETMSLSSQGTAKRTVYSPPLPTSTVGTYILRLVIDEPPGAPLIEDVRYRVTEESDATQVND